MTSPDARALPFDTEAREPLPDVPESGTLLVAYTPGARADGWAADAVLALARGWKEAGRRVFLCDVAMEDPHLHTAAEIGNVEGMSDSLRYGTSFKRAAHRLEPNLFVATAGSVAVDAGALRSDPRWETFTGGFRDAGALLVLYGPIDGASMGQLAGWADQVIVLSAAGETVPGAEIGERIDHHLLHGEVEEGAEPESSDDAALAGSLEWEVGEADVGEPDGLDEAEFESGDLVDDLDLAADPEVLEVESETDDVLHIGDLAPSDEDLLVADSPESGLAAELLEPTIAPDEAVAVPVSEPESSGEEDPEENVESDVTSYDGVVVAPKREESGGSGGGVRNILLVILLLIVAAVAASWFGLVEIPGLPTSGGDDASGELEAAEPAAETSPGAPSSGVAAAGTSAASGMARPMAEVAAFVVALASYADRESAEEARTQWTSASDGMELQFLLAPVEVNGQGWFRLLAGPAYDAESAASILSTLAELDGSDGSGWLVREAPMGFLLGETRGRSAADQRVTVLESLGVPAHVLRIPYSDGSEIYRVYGGAYADESEAGYLRTLLEAEDITNAPLVERIGALSE